MKSVTWHCNNCSFENSNTIASCAMCLAQKTAATTPIINPASTSLKSTTIIVSQNKQIDVKEDININNLDVYSFIVDKVPYPTPQNGQVRAFSSSILDINDDIPFKLNSISTLDLINMESILDKQATTWRNDEILFSNLSPSHDDNLCTITPKSVSNIDYPPVKHITSSTTLSTTKASFSNLINPIIDLINPDLSLLANFNSITKSSTLPPSHSPPPPSSPPSLPPPSSPPSLPPPPSSPSTLAINPNLSQSTTHVEDVRTNTSEFTTGDITGNTSQHNINSIPEIIEYYRNQEYLFKYDEPIINVISFVLEEYDLGIQHTDYIYRVFNRITKLDLLTVGQWIEMNPVNKYITQHNLFNIVQSAVSTNSTNSNSIFVTPLVSSTASSVLSTPTSSASASSAASFDSSKNSSALYLDKFSFLEADEFFSHLLTVETNLISQVKCYSLIPGNFIHIFHAVCIVETSPKYFAVSTTTTSSLSRKSTSKGPSSEFVNIAPKTTRIMESENDNITISSPEITEVMIPTEVGTIQKQSPTTKQWSIRAPLESNIISYNYEIYNDSSYKATYISTMLSHYSTMSYFGIHIVKYILHNIKTLSQNYKKMLYEYNIRSSQSAFASLYITQLDKYKRKYPQNTSSSIKSRAAVSIKDKSNDNTHNSHYKFQKLNQNISKYEGILLLFQDILHKHPKSFDDVQITHISENITKKLHNLRQEKKKQEKSIRKLQEKGDNRNKNDSVKHESKNVNVTEDKNTELIVTGQPSKSSSKEIRASSKQHQMTKHAKLNKHGKQKKYRDINTILVSRINNNNPNKPSKSILMKLSHSLLKYSLFHYSYKHRDSMECILFRTLFEHYLKRTDQTSEIYIYNQTTKTSQINHIDQASHTNYTNNTIQILPAFSKFDTMKRRPISSIDTLLKNDHIVTIFSNLWMNNTDIQNHKEKLLLISLDNVSITLQNVLLLIANTKAEVLVVKSTQTPTSTSMSTSMSTSTAITSLQSTASLHSDKSHKCLYSLNCDDYTAFYQKIQKYQLTISKHFIEVAVKISQLFLLPPVNILVKNKQNTSIKPTEMQTNIIYFFTFSIVLYLFQILQNYISAILVDISEFEPMDSSIQICKTLQIYFYRQFQPLIGTIEFDGGVNTKDASNMHSILSSHHQNIFENMSNLLQQGQNKSNTMKKSSSSSSSGFSTKNVKDKKYKSKNNKESKDRDRNHEKGDKKSKKYQDGTGKSKNNTDELNVQALISQYSQENNTILSNLYRKIHKDRNITSLQSHFAIFLTQMCVNFENILESTIITSDMSNITDDVEHSKDKSNSLVVEDDMYYVQKVEHLYSYLYETVLNNDSINANSLSQIPDILEKTANKVPYKAPDKVLNKSLDKSSSKPSSKSSTEHAFLPTVNFFDLPPPRQHCKYHEEINTSSQVDTVSATDSRKYDKRHNGKDNEKGDKKDDKKESIKDLTSKNDTKVATHLLKDTNLCLVLTPLTQNVSSSGSILDNFDDFSFDSFLGEEFPSSLKEDEFVSKSKRIEKKVPTAQIPKKNTRTKESGKNNENNTDGDIGKEIGKMTSQQADTHVIIDANQSHRLYHSYLPRYNKFHISSYFMQLLQVEYFKYFKYQQHITRLHSPYESHFYSFLSQFRKLYGLSREYTLLPNTSLYRHVETQFYHSVPRSLYKIKQMTMSINPTNLLLFFDFMIKNSYETPKIDDIQRSHHGVSSHTDNVDLNGLSHIPPHEDHVLNHTNHTNHTVTPVPNSKAHLQEKEAFNLHFLWFNNNFDVPKIYSSSYRRDNYRAHHTFGKYGNGIEFHTEAIKPVNQVHFQYTNEKRVIYSAIWYKSANIRYGQEYAFNPMIYDTIIPADATYGYFGHPTTSDSYIDLYKNRLKMGHNIQQIPSLPFTQPIPTTSKTHKEMKEIQNVYQSIVIYNDYQAYPFITVEFDSC